jgi:Tol biopolymer transport system component
MKGSTTKRAADGGTVKVLGVAELVDDRLNRKIKFRLTGVGMDKKPLIVIPLNLIFVLLFTSCSVNPLDKVAITLPSTLISSTSPFSTLTPTLTLTFTLTPTITPTPLGGGLGKIAFVSVRDGNEEIYVVNYDGSGLTRLTHNPFPDNEPNWSPDGSKIVYSSQRNNTMDLYIINADGSGETSLTQNLGHSVVEEPKWSPDGKKIAYVGDPPNAYPSQRDEIFIINADGTGEKRVTYNNYDDYYIQWSPDSQQIVFWSLREQGDIFVINIDGSGELKLTNNPKYPNHISYNIDPSWSPDGQTIIYLSTNFNTPFYEIYSIHPNGSDETRLTHNKYSEEGPQAWSPDGKKIVFTYEDGEKGDYINRRICVMDVDGSERKCITEGPTDDYPRWSPDGKKIVFESERDGLPEIYIMNPDGSDQTRITHMGVGEPWLFLFQVAP